jgi:type II secretion system protein H
MEFAPLLSKMPVTESESGDRMRARGGFTVIELLVVMMLVGIIAGATIPRLTTAMERGRLQRAASVVAADLRLAHSMAARRSAPVIVVVDTTTRSIRVRNFSGTDTTFSRRLLGNGTEYGLQRLTTTQASVTVYPNGIASGPIELTLRAGGRTNRVSMTRAGQVRITQ